MEIVLTTECKDSRTVNSGDLFYHFKGGLYTVIEVAKQTETGEKLVVYRSVENGTVWARPMSMFLSEIDKKRYPNYHIELKYRFSKVTLSNNY